jgi:prepilin-type N-terminal cleavage/methylation domain-containing protein
MKDQGVTLIELLVVISVIGILAVALGFSYVGWQGKYKVEKAAKDMHTDLMTARSMAMTRSRDYFTTLTTTSYSVIADVNDNGVADDAARAPFPKTVEYTISSDAGGTITFSKRGLISSPSLPSVSAEVAICLSTTADPDYDCIEMSQTRLIMGKLTTQISNGGECNATNCVAK